MANTKGSGSSDESINHYGLVRLRVEGAGNLQMRLISLGEVRENILAQLVLFDPTNIEPTRLSNLTEQRAQLEVKTTEFDEVFVISKIIIFAKPVAASYPG